MPIVSGSADSRPHSSLNGDLESSILQLDDEESFVVLERSTANDGDKTMDVNDQGYQALPISYSFPVFNNIMSSGITSSGITSSGITSSQTHIMNKSIGEIKPLGLQFESPHSSVSVEEIEKRLEDVIHENINLKEIVYQTNMAMKQQLKTVSLMQDRTLETQKSHQEKFGETKSLVLKLKDENKELKGANEAFGNEMSKLKDDNKQLKESNLALAAETTKLVAENEILKKQLAMTQQAVQTASESGKIAASDMVAENKSLKNQLAAAKEALQHAFENGKTAASEVVAENKSLKNQLASAKEALQHAMENAKTAASELVAENQRLKTLLASAEESLQRASESGKIAASELVAENKSLKNKLASMEEVLQHSSESIKKTASQQSAKEGELHQLVGDLTRKLEMVERARRDQEFSLDRLQAQLSRVTEELTDTQRKLAHSENALQVSQSQLKTETPLQYGEQLTKYRGLLKQLKDSLDEEHTRFNSLNSWLTLTAEPGNLMEFEISELRRLLQEEQEQSIKRKTSLYSAVSMIHEILADFQNLGEELQKVRADHAVKESHSLAYDEMQKKGFRERLDSLTAKLVEREEALAISDRHLASLQEAVRLQNAEKKGAFSFIGVHESGEMKDLKDQVQNLTVEICAKQEEIKANVQQIDTLRAEVRKLQATKDTVMVLEEQAKIYQADFEAERKARELVVAEKERIVDDLRHLMQRNGDLIKEINALRNNLPHEDAIASSTSSSFRQEEQTPSAPSAPRPFSDSMPEPEKYICPNNNCNLPFDSVEEIHQHVIACWDLQD